MGTGQPYPFRLLYGGTVRIFDAVVTLVSSVGGVIEVIYIDVGEYDIRVRAPGVVVDPGHIPVFLVTQFEGGFGNIYANPIDATTVHISNKNFVTGESLETLGFCFAFFSTERAGGVT